MTALVSPMSRMSIVCFFTIGVVPLGIVSVTSIRTSWLSPVFLTETSNARSVEALIVVSVSGASVRSGGLHDDLLEPGAVDTGGRAAGRGTVDAEPDRRHRARRVELDVLDEHGCRRRHVTDALVLHRRLGRNAEEHLPDDVTGIEQARLLGQLLAGGRRVLRVVVLRRLERVEEPLHAADAKTERLDGMVGRRPQRPRHVDVRRVVDILLLPVDEPLQGRLELGLLQPRRRQELGQVGADLGRVGADRAELRHRARVVVPLLVPRAALRPEDEQDDDQDRERDEPDQAEDRRHTVRCVKLGPPRPAATSSARGALGRVCTLRRPATHGLRRRRRSRSRGCRRRASSQILLPQGTAESTPCFGPEGRSPTAAKWR